MSGLYHYLWLFLIAGVLGWVMESCLVSVQQRTPVNRGFLTGPMCPIYGYGMCAMVLLLSPLPKVWWILLVGGGVIATAVEYAVGWLLESMFNQKWWDYSDHRWNLHGRIAIPETLLWAPLAMLAMLYFVPWLNGVVDSIPRPIGWSVLGIVAVLTMLDIIAILKRMNSFDRVMDSVRQRAAELGDRIEESADALREAFEESMRFAAEERRGRWRRLRDGFDSLLKNRLSGAYPLLMRRWRFDFEDDEGGDDNED